MASEQLVGVVLMGGQSKRMGTDKAFLISNNQFWYELALSILRKYCKKIYLSINQAQLSKLNCNTPYILDSINAQGPIEGLLSAHKIIQNDILVMACDMLYVQPSDIEKILVSYRHTPITTLYYNPVEQLIEPLLGIWTFTTLNHLALYYATNQRSLQNFLSLEKIALLDPSDPQNLLSKNFPTD